MKIHLLALPVAAACALWLAGCEPGADQRGAAPGTSLAAVQAKRGVARQGRPPTTRPVSKDVMARLRTATFSVMGMT